MIGPRGTTLAATIIIGFSLYAYTQVPPSFFNMQMSKGVMLGEPWPSAQYNGVTPFAGTRLWDAGTSWALINYAPGQYDWSMLDAWLAAAKTQHIEVLYCFGRVPNWVSSKPNDPQCAIGGGPGQCDPPNDLSADGTGVNKHWTDFVTALATRVNNPTYLQTHAHIKYWEMWDEAPNPLRWRGTIPQMLRMVSDARTIIKAIDSSAQFTSPSGGIDFSYDLNWFSNYFASGGGQYADIIAYHGYVQNSKTQPEAESLIAFLNMNGGLEQILKQYGLSGLPQWDTEGSWGIGSCCNFTDQDLQAGFTARYLIMHWLMQTQRFYWYHWDNDSTAGTLWLADPLAISGQGTILNPGIAYGKVYNWLVRAGNTIDLNNCSGPIPPNYGTWTCNITGPNGYSGQIAWFTSSQQCSDYPSCPTVTYTVPPRYTRYETLYSSQPILIQQATVNIGYLPILLENQALP